MGMRGRVIILCGIGLVFLTGITVDRYIQVRARHDRGSLRQEAHSPTGHSTTGQAPTTSAEPAPRETSYRLPDEGTELVLRLGGVRMPEVSSDGRAPQSDRSTDPPGRSPRTDPSNRTQRNRPQQEREPAARRSSPEPERRANPERNRPRERTSFAPRIVEHTVKPNETLGEIAAHYLGSDRDWKRIGDLNGIQDPRRLRAGQVLRIPIDG